MLRGEHARDAGYLALIWLSYAAGAILGSFVELSHGYLSLLLPIVALSIAIATDLSGLGVLDKDAQDVRGTTHRAGAWYDGADEGRI